MTSLGPAPLLKLLAQVPDEARVPGSVLEVTDSRDRMWTLTFSDRKAMGEPDKILFTIAPPDDDVTSVDEVFDDPGTTMVVKPGPPEVTC